MAELRWAATRGDLKTVQRLVSAKRDGRGGGSDKDLIKYCNSAGLFHKYTALHRCAESGKANVCEYLLNLTSTDGNEKIVQIDKGQCNSRTALYEACRCNHLEVARLLLDAGADIHRKDEYIWTPLHVAARHGHNDIIKLLLERGASKKAGGGWGGFDLSFDGKTNGQTPRQVATIWSHQDTAELLK